MNRKITFTDSSFRDYYSHEWQSTDRTTGVEPAPLSESASANVAVPALPQRRRVGQPPTFLPQGAVVV